MVKFFSSKRAVPKQFSTVFFRCFSAPILKSGEWAGLCKIDMEGSARKVIKYSSSVVRDWGADGIVQESRFISS